MTVPADDAALLRRSAEGDRSAFAELVDRHAGAVLRLLLSLGASPDDAEDALQDCFVAAWRGADGFRGQASAHAWLCSIARNALRRQHRKRAGEPAKHETLETLGAAAGWGSESDFSHRFEVEEELRWALGKIPREEREVIVLRDLEGLTGEETAQILGLSLTAMKSRLHRGRLRLMSVAREEGSNG